MTMAEVSSGLVHLEESKSQPLLSQPNSLQPSKTTLPKPNHPPNIAHQKPKDGNSRSCSVISWTPPNFPPNSIPKTIGTWSVHIKKSARKSSNVMRVTSHNSWAMDSSCTSAIPTPMKMTPKEQYGLG